MKKFLLFVIATTILSACDDRRKDPVTTGRIGDLAWTFADNKLSIAGGGQMPDFEQGGAPWAPYADRIEEIYVSPAAESIGNWAFAGLTNLTEVDYFLKVTRIGNHAFANCTALRSVWIGPSVTTIEARAFSDCPALTKVLISTETPPSLGEGNFTIEEDVLHSDYRDAYLADESWASAFSSIEYFPTIPPPTL